MQKPWKMQLCHIYFKKNQLSEKSILTEQLCSSDTNVWFVSNSKPQRYLLLNESVIIVRHKTKLFNTWKTKQGLKWKLMKKRKVNIKKNTIKHGD